MRVLESYNVKADLVTYVLHTPDRDAMKRTNVLRTIAKLE